MAVAYDNSAQSITTGTNVSTFSVGYSAASGADVFVAITSLTGTTFGQVSAIDYNGTAMTLLGSAVAIEQASFDYGYLYLYHAAAAGTGSSENITGTFSGVGDVSLQAASYTGVTSVGTPSTATGTSTSPSTGSVSLGTGQVILGCVAASSLVGTATISSPTGGTNRQIGPTSGAQNQAMALSDSSATATFGATLSASVPWGATAVVLSGSAGGSYSGSPTTATVAITGGTPTLTITGNYVASPTTATVDVTGATPSIVISGTYVASPTTATVHITGGTSVITASGNYFAAPPTATIAITGGKSWVIQNPFDVVIGKLTQGISTAILCVGDSTVFGFNDAEQTTLFGWTGRLGVALAGYFNANSQILTSSAAPNSWGSAITTYTSTLGGSAPMINILNAGVDGADLTDLGIFESDYFSNPASGSVVDLIFLQDGFNETAPSGLGAEYLSFVEFAQSQLPGVPIVITTENNYTVASEGDDDSPDFTTIFGAIITEFLPGETLPLSPPVQQSSVPPKGLTWIIDSQQANIPAGDITASGIHPNAAGYQIYADYLLSQLAPAVVGTIYPTTATIAITGGTPTVTITGSYLASPTTATVHITGSTPSIVATANLVASPTTATVHITEGTPVVVAGVFAAPTTATVAITTGTPVVTGFTTIITPGSASITISGDTATVTISGLTLITPASRITHVPANNRTVQVLDYPRVTQVPSNA